MEIFFWKTQMELRTRGYFLKRHRCNYQYRRHKSAKSMFWVICISSEDSKTFWERKQILFILHKLPNIVICLTATNDIKLLKVKIFIMKIILFHSMKQNFSGKGISFHSINFYFTAIYHSRIAVIWYIPCEQQRVWMLSKRCLAKLIVIIVKLFKYSQIDYSLGHFCVWEKERHFCYWNCIRINLQLTRGFQPGISFSL